MRIVAGDTSDGLESSSVWVGYHGRIPKRNCLRCCFACCIKSLHLRRLQSTVIVDVLVSNAGCRCHRKQHNGNRKPQPEHCYESSWWELILLLGELDCVSWQREMPISKILRDYYFTLERIENLGFALVLMTGCCAPWQAAELRLICELQASRSMSFFVPC